MNTPSTPVSSAQATQPVRARQQGTGTAGNGGVASPNSPFARMLQGLEDNAASEPVAAPQERAIRAEADDSAPADAAPAEQPAEEKRQPLPEDREASATSLPPADAAPAEQRAASLGQASWLAAARARAAQATDSAGRGRQPATLQAERGEAGLDLRAEGRTEPVNPLPGAAGDTGSLALDGAGWKPALDAASVQLATVPAATPAAAEFSLPSLGEAGAAPAPAAAEPPLPAQATLAPPPGSAAFPAALGAQLNTWLQDGVQHATLELNPQDMGPIDVYIALRDGRTLVELGADVAATRQALAEALPALAEALGDVGLSLAGGSVSDQTGQQQGRPADAQDQRGFVLPGWLAPAREGAADAGAATERPAPRGLVDLVA